MHNKLLPILIAGALLTVGARAQDSAVATPTSPSAAQQQQAQVAPGAQVGAPVAQIAAPAPNQVIYSPRLPSVAELTSVASAQGLTVEQVSQTANQVTVVYRNSAGQLNTVAYQLLANAANQPATVVVPSQAPTVVYQSAPSVVYYESYRPYYPRYYYPPVSVNLGFGYYRGWGGWGGGYWGRGYHGGHHWR